MNRLNFQRPIQIGLRKFGILENAPVRGAQCVGAVGNGFIRSVGLGASSECMNAFPTRGVVCFGYMDTILLKLRKTDKRMK